MSGSEFKTAFSEKMEDYYNNINQKLKKPWFRDYIQNMIKSIQDAKSVTKKNSSQYHLLSKYDVMSAGGEDVLIYKIVNNNIHKFEI